MRWFLGATRTPPLRRTLALAMVSLLALALWAVPASGQTPAPKGEECEGIASTVQIVEGEVVDRAVLVDEFSTNIHLFTVANQTSTAQIEVDGKPELIEVGTSYRFTTISIFRAEGTTASLLSSAFGDNLKCLTEDPEESEDSDDPEESEPESIPVENGVEVLDEDGEATPLEQPPFLPTPPISARTFFIGFGIFAVAVFLMKFVR